MSKERELEKAQVGENEHTLTVVVKSGVVLPDLVGVSRFKDEGDAIRLRGGVLRQEVFEEHGLAWTIEEIMRHAAESWPGVNMIILSSRPVSERDASAWFEGANTINDFPGFIAIGGNDEWAALGDEEVASE